jgi:hypothetical protein
VSHHHLRYAKPPLRCITKTASFFANTSFQIGGHFVVVSGAITIEKIGVFANPAWNLKVTHLSELASEKNEEQKINLIIIEKVGATATATTSTTDTPATQDATTTPTN